jgi:hypothetical protein
MYNDAAAYVRTRAAAFGFRWEGVKGASDESEGGGYPPHATLFPDYIIKRVPRVFYDSREHQPPVTSVSVLLGLVILLDFSHDFALTRWFIYFTL